MLKKLLFAPERSHLERVMDKAYEKGWSCQITATEDDMGRVQTTYTMLSPEAIRLQMVGTPKSKSQPSQRQEQQPSNGHDRNAQQGRSGGRPDRNGRPGGRPT